jgi:hypothetical protein
LLPRTGGGSYASPSPPSPLPLCLALYLTYYTPFILETNNHYFYIKLAPIFQLQL